MKLQPDFKSGFEKKLAQTDPRYGGDQDTTYSECVDASIEWQFGVHEYTNN